MVVKGLQLQTSEGICHFLIGDNPLLMKQLQCNAQVFPSDTFGGGYRTCRPGHEVGFLIADIYMHSLCWLLY